MLQEELAEGGSVLLLSYTNRAVNEICSKLVEHGIDFLRLGNSATCPEEYRDHVVGTRAESLGKVAQVRDMLISAKVSVRLRKESGLLRTAINTALSSDILQIKNI